MFTAAQTDLGKSEEWFWETEPRIFVAMLDESKRIDRAKMAYLAYLIRGGSIEDEEAEDLEGLDKPASDDSIAFLIGS